MAEADQICIIGCMSSACIAQFFGDILSRTFHRKIPELYMVSAAYNNTTKQISSTALSAQGGESLAGTHGDSGRRRLHS